MATPTIKWYYYDSTQWVDMSAYVLIQYKCSARWGIQSNKYTDRLARAGEMILTVKNLSGEFDPEHAGVLTGWGINTKVKLVISYDGQDHTRFYGYVERIKFSDPSTKEHTATVSIKDWMDYAYKRTLTESSIETYRRGGYAVDKVVDAVNRAPLATSYSEGDYEFEAIFDTLTTTTKAATELNKIVLSENGYFYNRHDKVNGETLVFESESYRNGLRTVSQIPKLAADCGFILKAGSATDHVLLAGTTDKLILNETADAHINGTAQAYTRTHGENILNSITVTAYPKRIDTTEQTLYSLGTFMKISSGETKTITVKYQNKTTKESCNAITSLMIQPVATTDYLMNTKSDGTGTDITSDLTVSVVYHTAGADVTMTNASAYTGKITKLELRGYGVYQDSEVKAKAEDTDSIEAYGDLELNIEQQYQRDTTPGAVMANRILQKEKDPRTKLDRVQIVANTSSTHMLAFLNIDVGDMVKITESNLGLANYYYVQGIEFEIISNSVIIYSWILTDVEPSVALGTRTLASMEFTYANNQVLDFGRIHRAEDEEERTVILSVYPHAYRDQSLFDYGGISVSNFYDSCRYQVYLKYASGTEMYIGRTNAGWTGDYGIRYSSYLETNIQTNAWSRIAVTEKVRDAVAEPTFYVGGAAVALQMGVEDLPAGKPCSGSKLSEDGINLYVGGYYLSDTNVYLNNFDGLIKNMLMYNRVLSAAEIALDAAGTLITEGLVFRGLCVPTSQTANYYDAALTTSQLLFDDVNGVSGIPRGTPTCREIT